MSRANVEVVRRLFDAYNRGDHAGAAAVLAPDVFYETNQEAPAIGRDAVRGMWERWESAWERMETVVEEYVDAGDHVLVPVLYSARGRGSGVEFAARLFDVYTVRHGLIVHKQEFRERADALAAAGLDAHR